jgi:hypothetical protein
VPGSAATEHPFPRAITDIRQITITVHIGGYVRASTMDDGHAK